MSTLELLKSLAIIIVFAKVFGLLARKLRAPQVAGEIIAGLLIGPSVFNWVQDGDVISGLAEIGVIILMFNAGLETNLKQLKKTGLKATLIACGGVFAPLVLGTLLYMCFYGFAPYGTNEFYEGLFIGTIMTATSVSITVQALRELGKIQGFVGTTIVSAAIIDDVIGILVLTFVVGMKDPTQNLGKVALQTAFFFVFALGVGYVIYLIFRKLDERYRHTRRIPIAGLALCFALAYIAEEYFGVADITGAYVAGIILCSIDDSEYIARKMDINSYMLFGPVFFASIGLQTDLSEINLGILWFSVAFVLVAMVGKIIGCGGIAKLLGFTGEDSLKIGVGMMTRGEVALIVAQKGLQVGMVSPAYFTSVILLIITSSIVTPILLKILYSKHGEADYLDMKKPVKPARR
ncbi:cation:proton antiporter [Lachnoclostridium sp. Marseille-P6806]|uniref:cation:proton antiporter n=1 Tax=Lachnoclostridium sp. Marseille-P6806 TaxID=2364793 RepID=UPI00102F4C14|nr:cation:proton antiporter [Lachnoclostridium sp. Marseille-P6806]